MAKARRRKRGTTGITWETVRQLVQTLPGIEEGTSYGTPAFRVRGKLFVRLHDSGEALVVRIDADERAMRMRADPEAFFITDHYAGYPWMLVRLAAVERVVLRELLEDAWRRCASRRLIEGCKAD
jgi:hypothetical protein